MRRRIKETNASEERRNKYKGGNEEMNSGEQMKK